MKAIIAALIAVAALGGQALAQEDAQTQCQNRALDWIWAGANPVTNMMQAGSIVTHYRLADQRCYFLQQQSFQVNGADICTMFNLYDVTIGKLKGTAAFGRCTKEQGGFLRGSGGFKMDGGSDLKDFSSENAFSMMQALMKD